MSPTGLVLVLVSAGLTMAANLLLRAGIHAAGGFAPEGALKLLYALFALFMQPLFVTGFAIYFLASVVWFRVVATEPLSVAYPVLVSLTFILVTTGAVVFFDEAISLRKIIGLTVILAGIFLVSVEKGVS